MAHFYGTVQGDKGEVSRLGHKRGGLRLKAKGHGGAILVILSHTDENDRVTIYQDTQENGGKCRIIWEGPLDRIGPNEAADPDPRIETLRAILPPLAAE